MLWLGQPTMRWVQLSGTVLITLVVATAPAFAQNVIVWPSTSPHTSCPVPGVIPAPPAPRVEPGTPTPRPSTEPGTPAPRPSTEGQTPSSPSTPSTDTATSPSDAPSPPSAQAGAVGSEGLAAALPGYIDSAIPMTQLRFRFDSAYRNNRPDRAEFIYPKCGCFKVAGLDPRAPGPPRPETRIDYQDYQLYGEWAYNQRLSAFFEAPIRAINPEANDNATGFGDINGGFKLALIADCDQFVTLQFRAFAPTGDPFKGLGTDHVSLEPALLVHSQLTDKLAFDGELRDWIPIEGTDFAGNVLRYGVGLSYLLGETGGFTIAPIGELVGWTVLGGMESDARTGETLKARGDTILNAKLGLRSSFGEHSSLYIGYGRALTGEVWYKDILRVEYRLAF